MTNKRKAPKPKSAPTKTSSSTANTSSTGESSRWIRTSRPFPLPEYVKDAVHRLDEVGHVAYVVGGSVRDFLLGRDIKDHDIATSAGPDELVELFPRSITVGKAFGVIKVPCTLPDGSKAILEIATFRKDMAYKDHRHPTKVVFSSPLDDASRRDFTINALYYDLKTQRIWDPVNGIVDLEGRIIRAIGEPAKRFREDALRLLRAVRFGAQLGFEIEFTTREAIRKNAKLIRKVSAERIRDELSYMLTGKAPARAMQLLADHNLLESILPEVDILRGMPNPTQLNPNADAWAQTIKVLTVLRENNRDLPLELGWAGLLYNVGKPIAWKESGGKSYNGYEVDSAQLAAEICRRLKMSRPEIEAIRYLVGEHVKFKDVFQMREATLIRWLRADHFENLLAFHRAVAVATDGNLAFYDFCRARLEEMRKASERPEGRLISGEDLIQLGFVPGKQFSQILRVVEDMVLEKKLKTQEEALEFVVKHFVK